MLALFVLSSCSTSKYFQVYKTESNLKNENGYLTYENSDCKVLYNLWQRNGNPGFIIKNKLDQSIYIVMPKTFYIKNGIANDYYKNREYSIGSTTQSALSYSASGVSCFGGASISSYASTYNDYIAMRTKRKAEKVVSFGNNFGVSIKESCIVCIPPGASKVFSEYVINTSILNDCQAETMYPKLQSKATTFTKEESPIVFINRIVYSLSDNGEHPRWIDNEFWVSEVVNMSDKSALEKHKEKKCGSKSNVYFFKIAAPNKFYIDYEKFSVPTDKWAY